ncbi:hypothetical protein [Rugosimonospora acidiphila]
MVAVSGCQPDSSPQPQATPCPVPSTVPAGTDAPADQAPGGGGLQIVDHGYTQVGGSGYSVSLGALVRNTSSRTAYRTTVALRVLDVQGRTAVDPLNAAQLVLEIPLIGPRQQVAVGSSAGVRTDVSANGAPDKVTTFDVSLGTTRWLLAGNVASVPSITATYRSLELDAQQPESGSLRYAAASTSCRPLVSRGTAAVFVNPAGTVVGGAFDPATGSPRCGTAGYDEYLLAPRSIPRNIDEAKTQITPYCDLVAVGGDSKPSGGPFN